MLHFSNLPALHWLWAVVAIAAIMIVGAALRRARLARFADAAVLARLLPPASTARRVTRAGLLLGAMLMLVASLIDPRWGVSYQEVRQRGVDIMVVLDVSRSMLAEDARPNRLERARQYVQDLVQHLAGDRVGLITFAGNASVSCPLTVDYGAFILSLLEAEPELVARGGSMLGDALRLAGESFTDESRELKAVVVLSDGEDQGSFPVEAAQRLHEERGVRVFTVGLGDAQTGARIPRGSGPRRTFIQHQGQDVWSRQDQDLLRSMALQAGGAYVPAGTGNVDLGRVYEERIAPATRGDYGAGRIRRFQVRYQWFAALALAALLAELLLGAGRAARAQAAAANAGSEPAPEGLAA